MTSIVQRISNCSDADGTLAQALDYAANPYFRISGTMDFRADPSQAASNQQRCRQPTPTSQREFADHMDAETFKAVRRELGLTEIGFGHAFGVSRRTVQNWGKQGPPRYIAELLHLALSNRIAKPQRSPADTSDAAAALSPAMSTLLDTALTAGWSKEAVLAAIEHWVASKRKTHR